MEKTPWQPLAVYELKYTVLPGQDDGRDKLEPVVRLMQTVKIVDVPSPLISSVFQTCSPHFTSIKPRKLGIEEVPVDNFYIQGDEDGGLTGLGGLRLNIRPRVMRIPELPLDITSGDVRPAETISLIRLTPRHLRLPDFPVVAAYLAAQRVRVDIQQDAVKGFPANQIRSSRSVNCLTALMLLMKLHGDIGALVHVLSLAPDAVASDIRRCKLAQAIGTTAACVALSSIFTHLAKQDYLPNQPLLVKAAADILSANLDRRDFRQLLQFGKTSVVMGKMRRLIDVQPLVKPDDPLSYARFAAIREGIIYGAIINFVNDQTRNWASTTNLAAMFADVAANSAALFSSHLHGIGPRPPLSFISLVSSPLRMLSGPRWTPGIEEQAVTARFEACVAGMAKRGWIAGWPHELKGVDGLRIAQDYADEARRVMRMVSSRPSPAAVGSWRDAMRGR